MQKRVGHTGTIPAFDPEGALAKLTPVEIFLAASGSLVYPFAASVEKPF
jgi:hypothetical protein